MACKLSWKRSRRGLWFCRQLTHTQQQTTSSSPFHKPNKHFSWCLLKDKIVRSEGRKPLEPPITFRFSLCSSATVFSLEIRTNTRKLYSSHLNFRQHQKFFAFHVKDRKVDSAYQFFTFILQLLPPLHPFSCLVFVSKAFEVELLLLLFRIMLE